MINLKDKRCERDPCRTQPVFGFPGGKARFCSTHKAEGMVNVRHKKCRQSGCSVIATFALPGTNPLVCCFKHKQDGMVDVKRENNKERRLLDKAAETGGGREGRKRPLPPPDPNGFGNDRIGAAAALAQQQNELASRRLTIVDAIFASSERLPQVVANGRGGAGAGGVAARDVLEGEGSDESEVWEEEGKEEGEEEGEEEEEGDDAGTTAQLPGNSNTPPPTIPFSWTMPLVDPAPSNACAVPNHFPFGLSSLALLPGALPRGSPAIDPRVEAAVAAVAEATAATLAGIRSQNYVHQAARPPAMAAVSGLSHADFARLNPDTTDAAGSRRGRPPESSGLELAGETRRSPVPLDNRRKEAVDTEQDKIGTTLVWSCVLCQKAIAEGDRHVLVCCGHGLFHKACTVFFVGAAPGTMVLWERQRCPRCKKNVASALQVFV